MADGQDKQPDLSQVFVRMSEAWREQMEKAGAASKQWSDSMMPFLTARAADSGLFGAVQAVRYRKPSGGWQKVRGSPTC